MGLTLAMRLLAWGQCTGWKIQSASTAPSLKASGPKVSSLRKSPRPFTHAFPTCGQGRAGSWCPINVYSVTQQIGHESVVHTPWLLSDDSKEAKELHFARDFKFSVHRPWEAQPVWPHKAGGFPAHVLLPFPGLFWPSQLVPHGLGLE